MLLKNGRLLHQIHFKDESCLGCMRQEETEKKFKIVIFHRSKWATKVLSTALHEVNTNNLYLSKVVFFFFKYNWLFIIVHTMVQRESLSQNNKFSWEWIEFRINISYSHFISTNFLKSGHLNTCRTARTGIRIY